MFASGGAGVEGRRDARWRRTPDDDREPFAGLRAGANGDLTTGGRAGGVDASSGCPLPVLPSREMTWGWGGAAEAGGGEVGTGRVGPDPSSVMALRVPADGDQPVALVVVKASAVALSAEIGGGLLDDSVHGVVDGQRYVIYLDEERVAKSLPDNGRAAALAARLGHRDRDWLADVRGDALMTGCTVRGDEIDVPNGVVAAACRAGLSPVGPGPWV